MGPDRDLAEAGRKMENGEIRRLAVVDKGRLVGVLSHGNVSRKPATIGLANK